LAGLEQPVAERFIEVRAFLGLGFAHLLKPIADGCVVSLWRSRSTKVCSSVILTLPWPAIPLVSMLDAPRIFCRHRHHAGVAGRAPGQTRIT
jgi:hypothetical protein